MEYYEILDYLYNKLPVFHRIGPAAYKANLNNTLKINEFLNHPEKQFKSIHIAGTNGKGSTAHILSSILQEKGLKTGLCTSPHLKDFRERIKINGKMIPEKYLKDFFNETNIKFIETINPSFFELTTGITFKYFADQKVDIAVVETGMGGRLDSTNTVNPLVSIITNIGLDHSDLLGDTLEKIAFEKAGIIKPNIPVIIGQKQDLIKKVFDLKAKENNASIFYADDNYSIDYIKNHDNYYYYDVYNKNNKIFQIESPLGGSYQNHNIITALQCCELLNNKYDYKISNNHIINGLKNVIDNTGFRGRWTILSKKPLIVCDTGHNKEALEIIIENINSCEYDKLHFIVGFMNDKKIDDILSMLPKDAAYYFTKANVPRSLDANILKEKAKKFGLKGMVFNQVNQAFDKAKELSTKDDMIFIGGSTFVVAEVLTMPE